MYEFYKDKVGHFVDDFTYNFYRKIGDINGIGSKDFQIKPPFFRLGKSKVQTGMMHSNADDLVGIGIRQDELQIREALKRGVKKIPRHSTQRAVLYHVRMGYMPKPKLIRIKHPQKIEVEMEKLLRLSPEVKPEFFTPIIVEKKGLFGTRYYLDTSTTQAIVNIRQIKLMSKGDPLRARRIRFRADHVEMELSGEGLETWKRMLEGTHTFK